MISTPAIDVAAEPMRSAEKNRNSAGVLLICHAAEALGIGHLMRMLALADALRRVGMHNLQMLILGEEVLRSELSHLTHRFLPLATDFTQAVRSQVEALSPQLVVFDLHPRYLSNELESLFAWLSQRDVRLVGVDSLLSFCKSLDLVWIPTFFIHQARLSDCPGNTKYGWDSYLIRKRLPSPDWTPGPRLLVLTGGSDATGQGESLPTLLDANLSVGTTVHWVRGPYAKPPALPAAARLEWVVHVAPEGLDDLIVVSNYALCIFGVSFFELLQYGIPTVVFSPYGGKDDPELNALRGEQVAAVAADAESAVVELASLMNDRTTAERYSSSAKEKFSINGADCLTGHIKALMDH